MHKTRHKYHSLTKHQQRHYFYYSAIGTLLSPIIYLVASLLRLSHSSSPIAPEPGFASRCSRFPADCDTTAPFIFDSLYSLAKQWPSTYGPNGHSIVPVKYSRNMPLYHAKQWEGDLKKPTWFAFDADDSDVVKSWVKQVLQLQHEPSFFGRVRNIFKKPLKCSNNNWQAVTETIMDSHRSRAIEVADIFDQNKAGALSIVATMNKIYLLSHAVLTPYFEYPEGEPFSFSASKEQTISRCSNTFTSYLNADSMNDFEGVLKDSIHIVVSKLCRWEWDLFEWSENHTTNIFRNPTRASDFPVEKAKTSQINKYREETDHILKWLGWSNWTDCPTKCAIGEICYIPMWPVIYSNGTRQGSIYAGSKLKKEQEEYYWSPKCSSREMHQKAGGPGRDPENQMPDPASKSENRP
ncbi:hypothetical protein IFR05_013202 [Cadophora sp. M221]|nr:hypothetical protein IFR05_013202 [Cadophora sp. M221]